ncbi:serine O-acetyltransferase [Colwellia polaris]|jgi:serine O-acetyltransferase|uniref:serine O-acetyltransferase n=1 Tax=Colwellia polaris TaxID=326537 RepID=UPI000A172D88|nr:DapH/DapD/GlmU-related protein [Colwellia polaris]
MDNFQSLIKSDFNRKLEIFLGDGAKVSLLRIIFTDGSSANVIQRLAFECAKIKILSPLALLFQHFNRIYNGCTIGTKATFSGGLVLMHPSGVVINSKVIAGKNITIESGVVIGDEKGFSPKLGDNVFIGSGAKIIGNVKVGNNVKIGANAVVVKDVPDNCTALGIPAKSRLNN